MPPGVARGDDVDGSNLDEAALDRSVESSPAASRLDEALRPALAASLGGGSFDSQTAPLPTPRSIDYPVSVMPVPIGFAGPGGGAGRAGGGVPGKVGDPQAGPFRGRMNRAVAAQLVRQDGGSLESEAAVELGAGMAERAPELGRQLGFRSSNGTNLQRPLRPSGRRAAGRVKKRRHGNGPVALPGSRRNAPTGSVQAKCRPGPALFDSCERDDGSFWEGGGGMYSHGLAAIALCEAYGMTRDARSKRQPRNRSTSSFPPKILSGADGAISLNSLATLRSSAGR